MFGLKPTRDLEFSRNADKDAHIRTSKRTNDWSNEALSIKLKTKLSEDLLSKIEATAPYTCVMGIHPNWRVASYR